MPRLLVALLACLFLSAPAWSMTVDINTASEAELDTLPGIGPAKAADIIAWREANGPFTSPAQLDDVPGIGEATLSRLLPLVTVGGAGAAARHAVQAPTATPPAATGDLGLLIQAAPVQAEPASPAEALVTPSPAAGRIDINTASAAQLMDLPGIGASIAALIVTSREQQGPFSSCSDLQRVTRIGAKTVANLEHLCLAGSGGTPQRSTSSATRPAPRSPAAANGLVNVNSASAAELDTLPGIGASYAARIIADREQNGPYSSCADLQRVNGIGATTVANLEHLCTTR